MDRFKPIGELKVDPRSLKEIYKRYVEPFVLSEIGKVKLLRISNYIDPRGRWQIIYYKVTARKLPTLVGR
jgi:hypothetical protein